MRDWHELFLDRMQGDRQFSTAILGQMEKIIMLVGHLPSDIESDGLPLIANTFINMINDTVEIGDDYEGDYY